MHGHGFACTYWCIIILTFICFFIYLTNKKLKTLNKTNKADLDLNTRLIYIGCERYYFSQRPRIVLCPRISRSESFRHEICFINHVIAAPATLFSGITRAHRRVRVFGRPIRPAERWCTRYIFRSDKLPLALSHRGFR